MDLTVLYISLIKEASVRNKYIMIEIPYFQLNANEDLTSRNILAFAVVEQMKNNAIRFMLDVVANNRACLRSEFLHTKLMFVDKS